MNIVEEFKLRNGLEQTEIHYLGNLCKRGHDWDGSGHTLRFKSNTVCVICSKITKGSQHRQTAEERFWSKVDKSGDCWEWIGRKDEKGYGRFDGFRLNQLAHRAAWELMNGRIPEGMGVLHRCDNPCCVRADNHLFLGTQMDNVKDMLTKGRNNNVRGQQNGNTTLTEADVREIKRLYFSKECGVVELAKRFGVSRVTIRNIYIGKTWSHLN